MTSSQENQNFCTEKPPVKTNYVVAQNASTPASPKSLPIIHLKVDGSSPSANATMPSNSRPPLMRSITSHQRSHSDRIRLDRRTSTPSYSAVLTSPRSFEQLYIERSYLLSSLTTQGQRSTDLMRRLSAIEEMLSTNPPPDQRRRARKQAGLLKSKISSAAEQEKAILMRLSELYVELQNRERWMHVQHERRESYFSADPSIAGYPIAPSPLIDMSSIISSPLDACSPVFVPEGYFSYADSRHASAPSLVERVDGMSFEERQETPDDNALGNRGLTFEFTSNELFQLQNCSLQHPSTYPSEDDQPTSRDRRLSLPGLRCLWPDTQEDAASEQSYTNDYESKGKGIA